MKLIKRKTAESQITKQHCRDCNGVGNVQRTDYQQPPNKVGAYPIVEVRCKPCNGQGWTAA